MNLILTGRLTVNSPASKPYIKISDSLAPNIRKKFPRHICITVAKSYDFKNLSGDEHLPKRPRKSFKLDLRYLVPGKLIRVWYH